jgi:hypothetical protein
LRYRILPLTSQGLRHDELLSLNGLAFSHAVLNTSLFLLERDGARGILAAPLCSRGVKPPRVPGCGTHELH